MGPTQIMYKANLSWVILVAHLKELVKYEIISEHKVNARMTYLLTNRGIKLLQSYLLVVAEFEQFDVGEESPHGGHQSASLLAW